MSSSKWAELAVNAAVGGTIMAWFFIPVVMFAAFIGGTPIYVLGLFLLIMAVFAVLVGEGWRKVGRS